MPVLVVGGHERLSLLSVAFWETRTESIVKAINFRAEGVDVFRNKPSGAVTGKCCQARNLFRDDS